MNKLILGVFLLTGSFSIYEMSVSTYFFNLRSLSDKQLIKFMTRNGNFGSYNFRRSFAAASSCKAITKLGNQEKICFASQPMLRPNALVPVSMIGLIKPTTASSTIKTKLYFDTVRSSFVNITNAESKIAQYIRSKFLDASSKNCGIITIDIPTPAQKKYY